MTCETVKMTLFFEDHQKIIDFLKESDVFVPGYIPPSIGLYSLEHWRYFRDVSQEVVILLDRNITSRLVRIIKNGVDLQDQQQYRKTAALLAFSQCFNLDLEPGVSLHELAEKNENSAVLEELAWFRAADNSDTDEWIAIALGRADLLSTQYQPTYIDDDALNFKEKIKRWEKNYAVLLKVAELELGELKPKDKALSFSRWMYEDFVTFAGPAAIFACLYFSPRFEKKGLLKNLKSGNRDKAIDGVKNAAWDITYISQFTKYINDNLQENSKRYIFASFDKKLIIIAGAVFSDFEDLFKLFREYWDEADAFVIAEKLFDYLDCVSKPESELATVDTNIDHFIEKKESFLRKWISRDFQRELA